MAAPGRESRFKNLPGVTAKDSYSVDPRAVVVEEGFNARDFTDPEVIAHIERLSKEIELAGVLQPITVRNVNSTVVLVDGECRLRATLAAIERGVPIKTIPAQLEGKYTNETDRLVAMSMRNDGRPFSMLERGSIYKRLMSLGHDEKKIGAMHGMSAQHVRDILDLSAAPEEVRAMVSAGSVSASRALDTVRHEGDGATEKLKAGVEKAAAEGKKRATGKHIDSSKPKLRDLYNGLVQTLQTIAEEATEPRVRKMAKTALENAGEKVKR